MNRFQKWWWRFRYNWIAWRWGWEWGIANSLSDDEHSYDDDPEDALREDWRGD